MKRVRDWLARHRDTFRRVAHVLEAITLVLVIAMGGAVGGYALAQWQARDVFVQMRADHAAEIERLQGTFSWTLQALAPQLGDIAQTASAAAGAAAQAAETSAEAARTVKQAARSAPAPLSEAERSRVNGAIEAANRKLKEGGR
jgi:predicted PurR-regulated permease PerM